MFQSARLLTLNHKRKSGDKVALETGSGRINLAKNNQDKTNGSGET
jgi:hypothetical protein